jgi:hypothetical protein
MALSTRRISVVVVVVVVVTGACRFQSSLDLRGYHVLQYDYSGSLSGAG